LPSWLGLNRILARIIHKCADMLAYTRGHIYLLERKALENTSCECYGVIRDHFEHLMDEHHEGSDG
jgi:hypothetical protein